MGNPYKIVTNKFQKLEIPALRVDDVCLVTEKAEYDHLINEVFSVVNDNLQTITNDIVTEGGVDLMDKIRELENKNKIKILHGTNESHLKIINDKCLELAYFPKIWKRGKIKLIRYL